MKRESEFATEGPAYVPTDWQLQREYRPRYPLGYVPRDTSSIGLQLAPCQLRRGTPSPIAPVSDAQRQQVIARRRAVSRRRLACEILRESGRAFSAAELAARLEIPAKQVATRLRVDIAAGRIAVEPHPGRQHRRLYRWIGRDA